MLYSFKGMDGSGKTATGSLEASGPREARARLRGKGLFVTGLKEEKTARKKRALFTSLAPRIPPKEMTSFMRQLASLLKAGIPLLEALNASQEQSGSATLSQVVQSLKDEVRQGEPLADSMAKSGGHFDPLTVALVRAGEAGGKLPQVFNEIAAFKESSLVRENSIKSATVYPVVMAVLGTGLVLFLLAYVVPKITVIFEDFEQALPLSTRILISFTDIIVNYGIWLALLLAAALFAASRLIKTAWWKKFSDKLAVNVWVIGPVVRAAILARWSHTTSILLQSGIPLLRALRLSKEVTQNSLYEKALETAINSIREGGGVADSLKTSKLFPPVALQMVAAGEKSGHAAELLKQVANDQSMELENRLSALMSLVQPALIVVMGLIIGFIVMAILLPIFEISQLVG
ncbi:MAG: type II secretion system F family protein [Nitrospinota bacterium]